MISPESDQSLSQYEPVINVASPSEKVSKLSKYTIRMDRFNNPISSRKKVQLVTFRDQVTKQKLVDVYIVQNWKEYYK